MAEVRKNKKILDRSSDQNDLVRNGPLLSFRRSRWWQLAPLRRSQSDSTGAEGTARIDRVGVAFAWMVLSAASFSLMAVFVKRLSGAYTAGELVFYRSIVNWAVITVWMLSRGESFLPPGKPLLVFRGVVGVAGMACLFYAIGHLPLPIAMLLSWCSPIFVILFSRLLLGERMRAQALVWLVGAFVGLLFLLGILPPSTAGVLGETQGRVVSLSAALIGLLGAAFGGSAYVAVRAASARVAPNAIIFYFAGVSTVLSALWSFWSGGRGLEVFAQAHGREILLLALGATLGQIAMTRAYQNAAAGVVSSMNFLNAVFSALLGKWLFEEALSGFQWLGLLGAAVCVTAIALTHRNRQEPSE
jgi:drug/metabolite transporter (DMT)-like permease